MILVGQPLLGRRRTYIGLWTMVLKGGSVTTIYCEVSSGLIFSLLNSYLAFCVWHLTFSISHPLFFISHIAFSISHLTFFISHLAFSISHLAFFISHRHLAFSISHLTLLISHLVFLSCISHFLSRMSHFSLELSLDLKKSSRIISYLVCPLQASVHTSDISRRAK